MELISEENLSSGSFKFETASGSTFDINVYKAPKPSRTRFYFLTNILPFSREESEIPKEEVRSLITAVTIYTSAVSRLSAILVDNVPPEQRNFPSIPCKILPGYSVKPRGKRFIQCLKWKLSKSSGFKP